MIKLHGQINPVRLHGRLNVVPSDGSTGGPLQERFVYPSHSEQIIVPDEDFYGLSIVTVKATPRLPAFAMSVCEGNGDIFYGDVVENVAIDGVAVSARVGKVEEFQALYNGVKLPKIPDSLLEECPYAWIRKNTTTSQYDLAVATTPWYYSGVMKTPGNSGYKYCVDMAQAENVPGWTFNSKITSANFTVNSSQSVLWSNHDIANGSPTATDIYFAGTEPVPID